jgi:hypothetical protein
MRDALFRPRRFFSSLPVDASMREPALFTLLVGAISGALGLLATLVLWAVRGEIGPEAVGIAALQALLFSLLSPLLAGVFAGLYLFSIRTFVGKAASFRQVYVMVAYAWSAMILAWAPVLSAVAFTYAFMAIMFIAVRATYDPPPLTALICVLVAYVPAASVYLYLIGQAATFST